MQLRTKAIETNSSALYLSRDSRVVIDEAFDDAGTQPIYLMSCTKPVLGMVVGRAVTMGLLPGLDLAISELFPEWRQGRKRDITLRHILTHTSGLQNVPAAPEEIYPADDFVQLALCAELSEDPGTTYRYNNKAANLVPAVIERATGRRADEFAAAELFAPLGITLWHWQRDAAGNPHGMAGLSLRAGDLARLGQLLLDDGGDLLSSEWVHASMTPATSVTDGMGLFWSLLPDAAGVQHSGYLGQYMLIHRPSRTVAVRLISPAHERVEESESSWHSFVSDVLSELQQ